MGGSQPLNSGGAAGRPAAGRPVLQGPQRKLSAKIFAEKPLPPRSGAAEVYSYKFRKQKNIFVKNKTIKYKNKKTVVGIPPQVGFQMHGKSGPVRIPRGPPAQGKGREGGLPN